MQSTSSNSNDKNVTLNKNQDNKKTSASNTSKPFRPNVKPIKTVQKQLGISRPTVQKRKAEELKSALSQTNLNKIQGIIMCIYRNSLDTVLLIILIHFIYKAASQVRSLSLRLLLNDIPFS
jgi:hypothetical protein